MAEKNVTWCQPANPPPPMFTGAKERDFVKQVNDELIERVIGQGIVYYPVSTEHTNYHELYGEAIHKNFLTPVKVNALISWEGMETNTTNYGIDRRSRITINFHKRRLTEDQDLNVREGDFVLYGKLFYEIVSLNEPRQLFGQVDHKMEIAATCIRARDGVFEEAPLPKVAITKYQLAREDCAEITGGGSGGGGGGGGGGTSSYCIPKLSGADPDSDDYAQLVKFASSPGDHAGCQFYLTSTGDNPVGKFIIANKWYFNEGGVWYPSPFYKRSS